MSNVSLFNISPESLLDGVSIEPDQATVVGWYTNPIPVPVELDFYNARAWFYAKATPLIRIFTLPAVHPKSRLSPEDQIDASCRFYSYTQKDWIRVLPQEEREKVLNSKLSFQEWSKYNNVFDEYVIPSAFRNTFIQSDKLIASKPRRFWYKALRYYVFQPATVVTIKAKSPFSKYPYQLKQDSAGKYEYILYAESLNPGEAKDKAFIELMKYLPKSKFKNDKPKSKIKANKS